MVSQSALRHPRGHGQGQASLEMTVALFCAILLVFGGMKICAWVAQRLVARQKDYDATRVESTDNTNFVWKDQASKMPLRIFNE